MKKQLEVGDIFKIEKGMKIYAHIPERFIFCNSPNVITLHRIDITVGEIRAVAAEKDKKPNDTFDTSIYIGNYIVVETNFTGGGTGHGPHDIYPDGHLVTAQKLNKNGNYNSKAEKIAFYQSGCFTAMIYPKQIKLIGTKKMTFI